MYQIDFLPEEYRHRRVARRQQVHRLLLLGVAAAMLASGSLLLYFQQKNLEEQLELVRPAHCALLAQQKQLNILQTHWQSVRSVADLICYLRHPWPRTQILAELLTPLPQSVTLEQLCVDLQAPEQSSPQRPMSRSEQEAEKARLAAMPPASRDMYRIRQECDRMQTIVRLTGSTVDAAALHRYLATLEKANLFTKVHLLTLEKTEDPQTLRFQVRLVVRPGYGQAGGPNAPGKSAALNGPPASPRPSAKPSPSSASQSSRGLFRGFRPFASGLVWLDGWLTVWRASPNGSPSDGLTQGFGGGWLRQDNRGAYPLREAGPGGSSG